MDASVIIALCIITGMMFCFITELTPIAMTALLGVLCFPLFGILSFQDVFNGFGNDIILLAAGSMVIGGALFETGMAAYIGEKIVKVSGGKERNLLVAVILGAAFLSCFLSNLATVAIFLPIITTAAAASGGNIKAKNLVMAASFAATTGGSCTLIGSSPQMIAQGLLLEGGHPTMGFFSLAYTGLPKVFLLLIYFVTIGYALQKKTFNFPDRLEKTAASAAISTSHPVKRWISLAILGLCVVGFITGLWTLGAVSITGAIACVLTRCLTQEQAYRHIELTTIIIAASSLGISKGLIASGAGDFLAQGILSLTSGAPNTWMLTAVLIGLSIIMGNIISHTATSAILLPIAIIIGQVSGLSVYNLVFCVLSGVNISYMTPISTPPNIMSLAAGYRFKDFLSLGTPLTLILYAITVLLCGLMF